MKNPFVSLFLFFLLVFLCIRIVRRFLTVLKVKGHLEKEGGVFSITPFWTILFSKACVLTAKDNSLSVKIVFAKKKHAKYHFNTKNSIEIYVGVIETYRTGRHQHHWNAVDWRRKGGLRWKSHDASRELILFANPPMDITSADPAAPDFLGNGDVIFDNITLYSVERFLKT